MNEFAAIWTQLKNGCPAVLTRTVEGCTYTRKFVPTQRLILLGGGHISQQVSKVACMLDFAVSVADDRPAFANAQTFPDASRILCDGFADAIDQLQIGAGDYVCVLTRGHRHDAECLRTILSGTFPAYLGMVGSKRRVAGLKGQLEQEGFDPEALRRIHAPIGLDIGAVTPAEIAISICAQLIAHRRSLSQEEGRTQLQQTNPDMDAVAFLARADVPRAMLLVLQTQGSTPVKSGALMAVDQIGRGYGTIGGGCGEAAAMGKARRLIGTGEYAVITVDLSNDVAADQGMVCGGAMRVLVEDMACDPRRDEVLSK